MFISLCILCVDAGNIDVKIYFGIRKIFLIRQNSSFKLRESPFCFGNAKMRNREAQFAMRSIKAPPGLWCRSFGTRGPEIGRLIRCVHFALFF